MPVLHARLMPPFFRSEAEYEIFKARRLAQKQSRKPVTVSTDELTKEISRAKHERNSALELDAKMSLASQLATLGIEESLACPCCPSGEHRFDPARKWRFDAVLLSRKIGVEIEGGTHGGRGRHVRMGGYEHDAEKYNSAAILEWTVLRFTYAMIRDGRAAETVNRAWRAKSHLAGPS